MRLSLKCTLVVAIAVGGCAATGGKGSVNVPHLELEDVNGRQHYLSDYIGKKKAVVMTFWATWCMPCRIELRHLMKIYEQQKDNGLEVLAVSIDGPETVSRVRPFVRQAGFIDPEVFPCGSEVLLLQRLNRDLDRGLTLRILLRHGFRLPAVKTPFEDTGSAPDRRSSRGWTRITRARAVRSPPIRRPGDSGTGRG